MNIKDLSQDDLALLLSMQFFMCDVDLYNYKDLYEQLGNTDIESLFLVILMYGNLLKIIL